MIQDMQNRTLLRLLVNQHSNINLYSVYFFFRDSQISTIEAQQVPIPVVTCDFASDISTSEAGDMAQPPDERKDTLKVRLHSYNYFIVRREIAR